MPDKLLATANEVMNEAPRVHIAARRRGSRLAAGGARAATDAVSRLPEQRLTRYLSLQR
jgi:hypothetical protein